MCSAKTYDDTALTASSDAILYSIGIDTGPDSSGIPVRNGKNFPFYHINKRGGLFMVVCAINPTRKKALALGIVAMALCFAWGAWAQDPADPADWGDVDDPADTTDLVDVDNPSDTTDLVDVDNPADTTDLAIPRTREARRLSP